MKISLEEIEKMKRNDNKFRIFLSFIDLLGFLICRFIFHIILLDIIFLFLFCGCSIRIISEWIYMKKIQKLMENFNLKQEFIKDILYYPEDCLLTEHYVIIIQKKEVRIINYEDIALVYDITYYSRRGNPYYLHLILKDGQEITIFIDCIGDVTDYNIERSKVLIPFCYKNNDILVGKTKENRKILLEKYNIKVL